MTMPAVVIARSLGRQLYNPIWQQLKDFTNTRTANTLDEIWMLEHEPVFTQGQAGKAEHLLQPGKIPLVQSDRGGQITYHGPGQLILYLLVDINSKKLNVRQIVTHIEQAVVQVLASYNIAATTRSDAPGVYVNDAKICAVGLRVRHGCTYHGLSLNVNMDLEPFSRINPCGYAGMQVTQLSELVSDLRGPTSVELVGKQLLSLLATQIGYSEIKYE